jgi:hypothetical protein
MNILGYEISITKFKEGPPIDTMELSELVNQQITSCNGQLRGVINTKAHEYNEEILQYYMGQVLEAGIAFGIRAEKQSQLNNKIKDDNH